MAPHEGDGEACPQAQQSSHMCISVSQAGRCPVAERVVAGEVIVLSVVHALIAAVLLSCMACSCWELRKEQIGPSHGR